LVLYGTQLSDDERTAETPEARQQAHLLLDFLTPIIKSWPSEYGPKANDLAIQVLAGHGYINEHPVEMFYRDNRLNPIHEGTTGIQSLDLLARKVPMNNLAGYIATLAVMETTIAEAQAWPRAAVHAQALQDAVKVLKDTTRTLLGAMQSSPIDLVLANSVTYLELFGHVTIAWLWLKQGMVAEQALEKDPHPDDVAFYQGKMQALQYFYHYELPKVAQWSALLVSLDNTTHDMQPEWF